MFSIGLFELFALFCLALIFLGPQSLLDLAKDIARIFHHLRAVRDDLNQQIQQKKDKDSP